MQHLQLTGGAGKEQRRELDFYPTPPDVTRALLFFLKWPKTWHLHDPACGDGAMCKVFEEMGYYSSGADVRTDSGFGEQGVDFLKRQTIPGKNERFPNDVAIITNPPFSLSEDFIRHALFITPWVAMLLKSQYWHAAKRFQLFNEFPPAMILPLTWRPDFMQKGKGASPTMEVLWTVWQPASDKTIYKPILKQ